MPSMYAMRMAKSVGPFGSVPTRLFVPALWMTELYTSRKLLTFSDPIFKTTGSVSVSARMHASTRSCA